MFAKQSNFWQDYFSAMVESWKKLKTSNVFLFSSISSPEPKAHRSAYSILMLRRRSYVIIVNSFKHLFLQNRLPDQSQILCGASLVGGTKVCSQHLGHMTKMTATPIYGKPIQKSCPPELAGRFSLNLVCSIEDSSPS